MNGDGEFWAKWIDVVVELPPKSDEPKGTG
jgi:hypothetical protein